MRLIIAAAIAAFSLAGCAGDGHVGVGGGYRVGGYNRTPLPPDVQDDCPMPSDSALETMMYLEGITRDVPGAQAKKTERSHRFELTDQGCRYKLVSIGGSSNVEGEDRIRTPRLYGNSHRYKVYRWDRYRGRYVFVGRY